MSGESHFNQMLQVLQTVESLPEACQKALEMLAVEKVYDKNDYFATEGEYPTDLAFLCNGTFRAFYRSADGIQYNKTFFTDNTFMIALTAMITGDQNLINIQTLEKSTVLQFNYLKFTRLFDEYHSLERLVRKVIEFEWAKAGAQPAALVPRPDHKKVKTQ
jgi:CRP-like cAMP-binding protein